MKQILIFSGAGLSAESGISTFRDNDDGLWTTYNPDQVANIHTFNANKSMVFDFYNDRRVSLSTLKPNAAHFGIAVIQKKYGKENVKIYTQNIDNFLEQAGCEEVVHVHGEMTQMQCLHCNTHWDIGHTRWEEHQECPHCDFAEKKAEAGSLYKGTSVKPGVVFFGEIAPEYPDMYAKFRDSRKDIILVIGTSGEVVSMDKIAGNRRSTRRSFTILNNKDWDKFGHINYKLFNKVFLKPASAAIDEISLLVDEVYNKL